MLENSTTCHGPQMRAIQVTPMPYLQDDRQSNHDRLFLIFY